MTHNQLFNMIKHKRDWRECQSKDKKLSAEWDIYEEGNTIYVLFQETTGAFDWIQNFSFTKRKYGDLKFHHGFYELYDLMKDDVIRYVKNIPSYKKLVVSGWSQGAAPVVLEIFSFEQRNSSKLCCGNGNRCQQSRN